MNEKIELLKELIEISQLNPQLKLNLIVQTLQRTDDMMKAKILSTEILDGDFSTLKEKAIDNLIGSFAGTNEEQSTVSKSIISNENNDDDDNTSNREKNMENEIRILKLQLEQADKDHDKLQEENNKLISVLTATKTLELIKISDKSINELYLQNLQDNSIITFDEAFILNDIIPKSYYKINRRE